MTTRLLSEEQYKDCLMYYKTLAKLTGTNDARQWTTCMTAALLGFSYSLSKTGPDAYDQQGNPVEIKNGTEGKFNTIYTGITRHSSTEMIPYLDNRFGPPCRHVFAIYVNGIPREVWEAPTEIILSVIKEKILGKDFSRLGDPRPSAQIPPSLIRQVATRIW